MVDRPAHNALTVGRRGLLIGATAGLTMTAVGSPAIGADQVKPAGRLIGNVANLAELDLALREAMLLVTEDVPANPTEAEAAVPANHPGHVGGRGLTPRARAAGPRVDRFFSLSSFFSRRSDAWA